MDEFKKAEAGDDDVQTDHDRDVPQDLQQAFLWYRKAAEQGHSCAQLALGRMYEDGKGVLQDHQQAANWYRKAAEQGNVDAQFALGRLYDQSRGVPDNKNATSWYHNISNGIPPVLRKYRYAILVLSVLILSIAVLLPMSGNIFNPPMSGKLPSASQHKEINEDAKHHIPVEDKHQWQEYQVQTGENLTTIFNNLGLSTTTLYKVLDADSKNNLMRLSPGKTIELLIDQANVLQKLKIRLNIKQVLVIGRTDDDLYKANIFNEEVEWPQQRYDGVINGSFSVSARNAGIPAIYVQKIANVFHWRFNFAKDLHRGDKFMVVVREKPTEGKNTGIGQLEGVEIYTQGKTYKAWMADDGEYYDGSELLSAPILDERYGQNIRIPGVEGFRWGRSSDVNMTLVRAQIKKDLKENPRLTKRILNEIASLSNKYWAAENNNSPSTEDFMNYGVALEVYYKNGISHREYRQSMLESNCFLQLRTDTIRIDELLKIQAPTNIIADWDAQRKDSFAICSFRWAQSQPNHLSRSFIPFKQLADLKAW